MYVSEQWMQILIFVLPIPRYDTTHKGTNVMNQGSFPASIENTEEKHFVEYSWSSCED